MSTTSVEDDVTARPADGVDAVCAAAVDLARRAAEGIAYQGEVGDHVGILPEGERAATHLFVSLAKGTIGWRWAVTVARAPRSRTATVSETVLLPGPDAVMPPAWVPWDQRIAPGDLGPLDTLPYRLDDPYLEPGVTVTSEDEEDRAQIWELGLGRPRVLSPEGRTAAATRWYLGSHGPTAEEAVHAAAACASCGYFLSLAGSLRQVFGVCANEWSPSDGQVVTVDHGCGAHSETDVDRPEVEPLPLPILDETGLDSVDLTSTSAPAADTQEPAEQELTAQEPAAQEPAAQEPAAQELTVQESAVPDVAELEPRAEDGPEPGTGPDTDR